MPNNLNPNYVLAPLHSLLKNSLNNVLLGLRIIEKIDKFPDATDEELQFFQFSMGGQQGDIAQSKSLFKSWVLKNGFEDIQKCFRLTLDRLFIFKTITNKIKAGETVTIEDVETDLIVRAGNKKFPEIIESVNSLCTEPLQYEKQISSINKARNCLVHANGIVSTKYCNNPEKDKLVISGIRFKLFFQKDSREVQAELGRPGPENAALMLGAEDFQFEFPTDTEIVLDLKQFLDILNTCIFVRADIEEKIKN